MRTFSHAIFCDSGGTVTPHHHTTPSTASTYLYQVQFGRTRRLSNSITHNSYSKLERNYFVFIVWCSIFKFNVVFYMIFLTLKYRITYRIVNEVCINNLNSSPRVTWFTISGLLLASDCAHAHPLFRHQVNVLQQPRDDGQVWVHLQHGRLFLERILLRISVIRII